MKDWRNWLIFVLIIIVGVAYFDSSKDEKVQAEKASLSLTKEEVLANFQKRMDLAKENGSLCRLNITVKKGEIK